MFAASDPDLVPDNYEYTLTIEGGKAWQHNGIKFAYSDMSRDYIPSKIAGIAVIDKTIGMEARSPQEWERVYEIPFVAKAKDKKGVVTMSFQFVLKNGPWNLVYKFDIKWTSWCESFTGTLQITDKKAKGLKLAKYKISGKGDWLDK